MPTPSFVPQVTMEHRLTGERVTVEGVTVLRALKNRFGVTARCPIAPGADEPGYEQYTVHIGDWFVMLPAFPEPYSVWRNFKGSLVTVLETGRHTETKEPLVVYREDATGAIWIRPLLMFMEHVHYEGKDLPRFTPVIRR